MQNLTKGNPITVILAFTLPLLIGSFFQLTYNFADSIIVGPHTGSKCFCQCGGHRKLNVFGPWIRPGTYLWLNHCDRTTIWSR